jgi:hypothetical protein
MSKNRLSLAERTQTQGNLNLLSLFIEQLLETPERFEALPERATIVLLPSDESGDDELLRANIEMAKQLAAQGKNPILLTVGHPEETSPQLPAALVKHS